ncbi:type II toxin-antitoxin system RelE/ParE family toxin [bacterium]|nr:type II toxin-antitoxin system RelE/ParE family toxin [bacterium]
MTYKFIISQSAIRDMNYIQKYIEKDNFLAAKKTIIYITRTIRTTLADNPHIGRYGNNLRTREFILTKYPYKIIYTVNGNELVILRVLHTSRKW